MKIGFTGRIARTSARRPWLTMTLWVVAIIAAIGSASGLGDVVTQDDSISVPIESTAAAELDAKYRATADAVDVETIIVTSAEDIFGMAPFAAQLDSIADAARGVEGVATVTSPSADAPQPVYADGLTALISVYFEALDEDAQEETAFALMEAVDEAELSGFTVSHFGPATAGAQLDALAEETLIRGELIGISVAVLILIVVFGALAAAGVPLLMSLVSIITAVGATVVVGRVFELSFFVLNMITMMGLALGIDYTLVMVQRFREELAKGRTTSDAVTVAGNTANRAVFFSGLTVVISLVGLLLVPSTIMRSLGMGAIIVAVTSVLAALTLLPAVMQLMGPRVDKGKLPFAHPGAQPRAWYSIARTVTNRPAVWATAGGLLLVVLALPLISMRLAFPGTESLPEDNELRVGVETLVDDFGYGASATVIAIDNAAGLQDEVDALVAAVEASPAFAETTVEWVGSTAFVDTKDVFDASTTDAEDALKELREVLIPAALGDTPAVASVGGDQAESVDFAQVIRDATPAVLAIVLVASFLLLLVAFRSVVIPLTAIGLNLLSAGAAFGVLVAVFQFGWGNELLGLPQVDAIAPWIPLFLFAVLFGLSMDYHMFLLTRMKERHDAGGGTRESVIYGLSKTGSLITGAALIMVAVFTGFAMGDLAEFAQMGFGLAVAVIIDATIVRTVVVPSVMTLLGRANWYLPRWLGWLPQMRIEPVEGPEVADYMTPNRLAVSRMERADAAKASVS